MQSGLAMPPSARSELARLQRGFLAFVTGSRAVPAELIHACEELAVYRDMYALRMAREVEREFPATRALLGAAAFGGVTRAYVSTHASRSFTLDGYGAALPAFLRRTHGRRDAAALAELERALAQVRSRGDVQLVRFDCDVELGYARFLRGAPIRSLHPRTTWLALHSRGGRAARIRVAAREIAFLRALLRGADLERAVAIASASGLAPAAIRRALERWVGGGLLRARYRSGSALIQAAPCTDSATR
jgi:Putative DNA-binding domain